MYVYPFFFQFKILQYTNKLKIPQPTRMNSSSIKKLLLISVVIFGLFSVLSYYMYVNYSTEKSTNVITDSHRQTKGLNYVFTSLGRTDHMEQPLEHKNEESVHQVPNKTDQSEKDTNSGNNTQKVMNEIVAPIDDFEKYPCIPGIPSFPTSSWTSTGKCVRMFNDTEKVKNLGNKCVTLRTSKGTTPICIYESVDDHYISGSLQKTGQWEGGLVDNVLNVLNQHPTAEFLDLGCNIGTYSLAAAAFGRRITAVDAVTDNLELLSKSLTLGKLQDKALLIWNAISYEYSKVALTKYKGNIGGTAIRGLTTEDKKNKETFITQTIKLDDLVPLFKGKTVMIKMDIETQEYNALLGGTYFFNSVDIPMIQMEIKWHKTRESGPKIVQYLAQRDFKVFADVGKRRPLNVSNIQTWPGDVYFLKS